MAVAVILYLSLTLAGYILYEMAGKCVRSIEERRLRKIILQKEKRKAQFQNMEHNFELEVMQESESGSIGVFVTNESKGRDINLLNVKEVKKTKDNAGIAGESERL